MDFDFAGTARFSVEQRLGEGGMGIVYRAFDRDQDAHVAIKLLAKLSPDHLLRFKREFRALQGLTHPNLVSLGELVEYEGNWFFTMELLEGDDFLSYVRRGDHFTEDDMITVDTIDRDLSAPGCAYDETALRTALRQLAEGVHALHQHGGVHRDIKPSNIIITSEDRLVLLDFGLVTHAEADDQSAVSSVVGTAAYMAPEQATSAGVGTPSDWYSIGVLLYESLTGQLPFSGPMLEVLMNKQRYEPPAPHVANPFIPGDLSALCVDLLRTDPAVRPDGEQILQRLGSRPSGRIPTSPPSSSSTSQRPPFVGRDAELAALDGAFAASRTGHCVLGLVEGESGIGKSSLVQHFLRDFRRRHPDAVVLKGRCYEREEVPFNALDGIVDALSRFLRKEDQSEVAWDIPHNVQLLARVFPVLRYVPVIEQASEDMDTSNRDELRSLAFSAFRELLVRVAERHPIILSIDDLQWADADSLALLAELLLPNDPPQLLLLATFRHTDGADQVMEKLERMERGAVELHRIQVSALPEAAAQELAGHFISIGVTQEQADSIVKEAAGHPLFIQELARHVQVGTAQRGVRLDDALWARVSRLDSTTRRLLEVVVVAGAAVRTHVAMDAAELSRADGDRAMRLLRVANLLRAVKSGRRSLLEPFHDRVRESVLARLDAETRRSYHRRLAVAYEANGAAANDPRVLVRHLEASGQPERAAVFAERAAASAAEALAFDRAGYLYEVALRAAVPASTKERRLRMQRGDALVSAGRGVEAAESYLLAGEGAPPPVYMDCRKKAAEQLLFTGHVARGVEILRELLADTGEPFSSSRRRLLMSLLWQRTKLRLRGLKWKNRHESEIAPQDLVRLDVYRAVAAGFSTVDTIRAAEAGARGLLLALRAGEPMRLARFFANEAGYHATRGVAYMGKSHRILQEARHIADKSGDRYLQAWVTGISGTQSYFGGAFRDAHDKFCQAEDLLVTLHGATWELGTVRTLMLLSLRHVGEFAELQTRFSRYLRDAVRRRDQHAYTTMRRSSSIVWLLRDDVPGAHEDLAKASWQAPSDDYHLQHWYELRAKAEIALYEQDMPPLRDTITEGLARYRRSLVTRVQIVRSEALWLEARSALADDNGNSPEALAVATQCAKKLAKERTPFTTTWVSLLRAAVFAGRNQQDQAVDELARCIGSANDDNFYTQAATWHRGRMIGGDEGEQMCAAVRDRWTSEGVVTPDKLLKLVAPGFPEQ